MWRGAGSRPDALRQLKQVRRGDRVLCYHAAPERSLYALAEVTRDPYPDPQDPEEKNQVADLRALERLPRQVSLVELRANPALRKMKFLKNVRLIISPVSDEEYQDILRMAGIVALPACPFPSFPAAGRVCLSCLRSRRLCEGCERCCPGARFYRCAWVKPIS